MYIWGHVRKRIRKAVRTLLEAKHPRRCWPFAKASAKGIMKGFAKRLCERL